MGIRKRKTKAILIILLIILLAAGGVVIFLWGRATSGGDVGMTVRESIKKASDLVTVELTYTDDSTHKKTAFKNKVAKNLPFTKDEIKLRYQGTIYVGIDMSDVTFKVDSEDKEIKIKLPEPEVISHEIDEDSIEYWDVKNSIFVSFKFDDYAKVLSKRKKAAEKKYTEDGEIYTEATEKAEEVLTDLIKKNVKGYDIEFDD
ncbi:MAG: DUF4230 domain-containing protein [Ruminococcus sp.]|nr:DUF4230 domain-containing protein [Ruminococcus sp.]